MIEQVNLVAIVGTGGAIGPSDGLPMMIHEKEAIRYERWFTNLTEGGIIVLGHRSMAWLYERGFSGQISKNHRLVSWTRDGVQDPDDLMAGLKETGRPIFICGGMTTFQTFMPYVQQFFIRRVALNSPHDNYMPPLFGRPQ